MPSPTSPNMSLFLPVPGSTAGPQWATELTANDSTIDTHDHTTGKGVKIPVAALTVNADFSWLTFGQTNIGYASFIDKLLLANLTNNASIANVLGQPYWRDNAGVVKKIQLAGDNPTNANKYIGQVATRTNVPYNFSSNLAYSMCRSMHYLREDVASVKIAFPGFYVSGGTETAIGAATSVTGSIEYPAGTFTQLRFAGSVTGSIPSGGLLWCDPTAIAIPRGAQFWVRTWTHATTGGAYHTGNTTRQLVSQGDLFQYSPTSISDVTMGGSIISSDSINMGGPCAIVGLTNRPSVAVIGDSRACGEYDVFSGNSGDLGEIARSIGPSYAYAYLSAGGDTAAGWASANTNRAALAAYFSHSMIEYGINDVNSGSSDAAIQGFINTIVASLPASQTKFITTIAPYATSTDNWATLVNQSAGAHESTRSANNIWRRTTPTGFTNCFDVSSVVESIASPGKWNVDGTAFKWTADGIHESPFAYQAIQASGVISTSLTVP